MPQAVAHDAQDEEGSGATLSTVLVQRLRQAILNGELAPGSKLRLEALRERLGMTLSRSPLREALSRLGAEGLVLIEDNRGYRVAPMSETNLLEVARLRVHMETLALREAIAKGSRQWEGEVVAALYRLTQSRRSDGMSAAQLEPWETEHRRLHMTLLNACGMPLLLAYCDSLHDLNDRYRRIFLATHPYDRDAAGEHRAIVDATLARDPDLACRLLTQHIERTTHNICAALQARGSTPAPRRASRNASSATRRSVNSD